MSKENSKDWRDKITANGYSWYQNEFYRICQIDDEACRCAAKERFHISNKNGTPASFWNPNDANGYALSFFDLEAYSTGPKSHLWCYSKSQSKFFAWDNGWEA